MPTLYTHILTVTAELLGMLSAKPAKKGKAISVRGRGGP
jgi:hypothetical protein